MNDYTIFRYDFQRDTWDITAHMVAESGERAIRDHALDGAIPNLGNYVAVPDDELKEMLNGRPEVRIGLDISVSVPESMHR